MVIFNYNTMLVKIKEENIHSLNNFLKLSFEELPFLFEKDETYIVDEVKQSLFITKYDREFQYCIAGLDMNVTEIINMYDLVFVRERRIYFPQSIFKEVK